MLLYYPDDNNFSIISSCITFNERNNITYAVLPLGLLVTVSELCPMRADFFSFFFNSHGWKHCFQTVHLHFLPSVPSILVEMIPHGGISPLQLIIQFHVCALSNQTSLNGAVLALLGLLSHYCIIFFADVAQNYFCVLCPIEQALFAGQNCFCFRQHPQMLCQFCSASSLSSQATCALKLCSGLRNASGWARWSFTKCTPLHLPQQRSLTRQF